MEYSAAAVLLVNLAATRRCCARIAASFSVSFRLFDDMETPLIFLSVALLYTFTIAVAQFTIKKTLSVNHESVM